MNVTTSEPTKKDKEDYYWIDNRTGGVYKLFKVPRLGYVALSLQADRLDCSPAWNDECMDKQMAVDGLHRLPSGSVITITVP